ncbi:ATP-dependent zinc protease family protein [Vibrio panuliri]|uniref:ATP-dependent Zn protease n=1 Tax=Vibrio panuliri TaxID=1381081 RepID=A0A1Q9HE41_9VIBR|nr:ATP-dependent zinc protease [Vibrio panuliri]KAB1454858.1 ATP-dependent zinc protease [Vibrio panuliri]OLQ85124.1 ATP-dependent Zn protease [Vibrio panuliri]OLQ87978.1 ATP-dependent Zn protease [Vibrio panuliri]
MFIRLTPLVALTLLSGCTLTNSTQNHQQTLSAIQAVETNLNAQITTLGSQVEQQAEYIQSLEKEIQRLQDKTIDMQTITLAKISAQQQNYVAPVATPTPPTPTHGVVLGAIERVTIDSIKQTFDARVDTGAATSSLNAVDIEEFERNGKKWVRFHLSDENTPSDDNNWIEAPIVKFVKIRQSTNSEVERRAVVELWVKVGKIHEKAQFTLADRSQMSHPVLLGREFIQDIAVVDVSKKYVQSEAE